MKSIKFIQHNSIANNTNERNSPFEQVSNIYGCDAPERLVMKLDYNNTPIEKFADCIKKFKMGKDQGQFEHIIIVGEDTEKVEHSFDFSSIISSVQVLLNKDDNGRYDPSEVQNMFLELIR